MEIDAAECKQVEIGFKSRLYGYFKLIKKGLIRTNQARAS